MPPKTRPVTAKALQSLLTRIGSVSSGTKDVLHARLSRDIRQSRLFDGRPDWKARQEKDWGRKLRILSIDMGIKNLAYCDAEVDYPQGNADLNATVEVIRWDKVDLISATRSYGGRRSNPRPIEEGSIETDEDVDPYSLDVMSSTAYWVVNHVILGGGPDIILIERQRWRSASSAAIQQWTVRVNTLEAMIWAILHTLKVERWVVLERLREGDAKRDYEVSGVDPKRVGQFWLGQHARASAEKQDGGAEIDVIETLAREEKGKKAAKIGRSKAEKKAKIAILRSWLTENTPSTAPSTPVGDPLITFNISGGATKVREALNLPIGGTRKKVKKKTKTTAETAESDSKAETPGSRIDKLDDVTDCFLQAAAWVAWESNRKQLVKIWEQNKVEDSGPPWQMQLDDRMLKIMDEKVNGG